MEGAQDNLHSFGGLDCGTLGSEILSSKGHGEAPGMRLRGFAQGGLIFEVCASRYRECCKWFHVCVYLRVQLQLVSQDVHSVFELFVGMEPSSF